MKPVAAIALASLCLATSSAFAQASSGDRHTFCEVEDTGRHDIWVSQVFPTPPGTDLLASALASEFHRHVATLGGAGNKSCVTGATRAAAEATRADIARIMGKRTFGIRVYDWHDVDWKPSAAAYANAAPAPAVAAEQFVYCRFVDTDKRVLVASSIFTQTMPPRSDGKHFAEMQRYASEFGARAATSQGVDPQGAICIASDTYAEADKSLADYKKSFKFTGIKRVELPFAPGPAPTAPASATAAASATVPASQPAVAARSTGPVDDVEEDFWRRISASTNARDFEDYLAAYPQGRHVPVARLEVRRLGGHLPAPAATTTSAMIAPEPVDAAVSAPAGAIDGDVGKLIASARFFQDVPAGQGVPVARSGSRIVNKTVPVTMDSRMQREAGSNLCRIEQTTLAGAGGMLKTTAAGQTWAGFLPLALRAKMTGQNVDIDSVLKLVSIDKMDGQPFPLAADNRFSLSFTFENTSNPGQTTRFGQEWSCRVGATAPASTTIPGMAGEQTEVACHINHLHLPLPPQDAVMTWYSAAGCFIQDPTR